ncbi:MAG TPA: hypothetical protein VGK48_13235 [Terriglobia bacterium]
MTKTVLLACGLVFAQASTVLAQAGNPQEQTQVIQKLMDRIDQLEKRVAELEGAKAQSPPPPPVVTAQPPAPPEGMEAIMHPNSMPRPTLNMAGFSDFTFSGGDQPGAKTGFSEGQFILHFNSNLSPRVNYLAEISLTARTDAGTGSPPATGFNPEVERSIIRFEENDYLKVSFGRYHTPINYWNTAFHHGQWLQTTVSRPEMTQFGGKFIPVHFVGALLEGAVPAGGLNLNYNVGMGNGRGAVISRPGDFGPINNAKTWLVNGFIRPDRFYGLQTGGSAYHDKVTTNGRDYDEWITSAHFVLTRERPEIIAEAADTRHKSLTVPAPIANSQAYYVQAAYRLPFWGRQWKPYYRFEYIHVPKSDTMFQPLPNLAGHVAGVRYDLTNFAAFKFEFRNQRRAPGLPDYNFGFMNISYTF